MRKYYKIFDEQWKDYKEGFPVFTTEEEAYTYYVDSLRQQFEEGFENLKPGTTDKEVFDIFNYEVHELSFEDLTEEDLIASRQLKSTSIIHFYENDTCILSIYEEEKGIPLDVGERLEKLFDSYKIVRRTTENHQNMNQASGISELALFYILDNNKRDGMMFATNQFDDEADYNYRIYTDSSEIEEISVIKDGHKIFAGSYLKFLNFARTYKGEE